MLNIHIFEKNIIIEANPECDCTSAMKSVRTWLRRRGWVVEDISNETFGGEPADLELDEMNQVYRIVKPKHSTANVIMHNIVDWSLGSKLGCTVSFN